MGGYLHLCNGSCVQYAVFTVLICCVLQGIKGAKGFVGDIGSAGMMGDKVCLHLK